LLYENSSWGVPRESFKICLNIFNILENNKKYINQNPKCEPQLGKRGLYQHIGGHPDSENFQLAMLWVLNLSDGYHSLVDISERSGVEFGLISEAAEILVFENFLKEFTGGSNIEQNVTS